VRGGNELCCGEELLGEDELLGMLMDYEAAVNNEGRMIDNNGTMDNEHQQIICCTKREHEGWIEIDNHSKQLCTFNGNHQ